MFARALKQLLKNEGGYVNDPDDIGGETYKGISRRFHKSWKGWAIIDSQKPVSTRQLTYIKRLQILVFEFYSTKFWYKLKCDQIHSEHVQALLFDTAVNMGIKPAVKLLQSSYNNIGLYSKKYIVCDGIIGPITLKAINGANDTRLNNKMCKYRVEEYFNKCETRPVKYKYIKGWVMRTLDYVVR